MKHIAIRQLGGASVISLPKEVLKILGLHVGSTLDLSIKDKKIILTPVKQSISLDALLKGSPKNKLKLSEEDKKWFKFSDDFMENREQPKQQDRQDIFK